MFKFIKISLLFACFTIMVNTNAQIINIPDNNFKNFLLWASNENSSYYGFVRDSLNNPIAVDINNDNEIDVSEALNVSNLFIFNDNIKDLTGIKFFKNLKYLWCEGNELTSLDLSGLNKLSVLNCSYNELTTLNLTGLDQLKDLNCQRNWIINLNLSGFSNLERVNCHDNLQLTTLTLTGLSKLKELHCGNNKLVSLDFTDCKNIKKIYCANNLLRTISNINGKPNLDTLFCACNILSTLDVSGCVNLKYLNLYDNNKLKSLYLRNVNITDFNRSYFDGSYSLKYICADVEDISLIQPIFRGYSDQPIINDLCSSVQNITYYFLNSSVKFDQNLNGCFSDDPVFPNLQIKINLLNDSIYAYSDNQGSFAMTLDSGSYTLTPQLPSNYFTCTPSSTTITFPEDTIPQQFCITPNGTHHDVEVSFIPIRVARPGFSDATYKVVLKNKGNQIENGSILFNYDESRQDYISASQTPSSVSSGALAFALANLQLFETREITVTMRTNAPTDNPAVNAGDVLQLSVAATINADENIDDNKQVLNQTVVGSFDPNDKTCLEGEIITPTIIGDFVHYLIRFENTGTANAENVVVTDYIDLAKFDISTLDITSTSHNCKTLISNGNKVQFVFDNINLPFTEPLKHGYVAFKIKTKSNLVIGDSLKNKADIYFDYNLPITTNTATSRIENVTSIKTNTKNEASLNIYPNPSNGNFIINFESKSTQTIALKIIDVNGSTIYEQKINHAFKSQLPITQNLPSGVYFITITSDKEQYIQKLLIAK